MSENNVIKSCIDILNVYKIFSWRNNTGAFQTKTGGYYKFGEKGSPDIIAICKGKFIGIECKMPGKIQNENQIEFQRKLERAGGTYLLIDNPDVLIKYLEK